MLFRGVDQEGVISLIEQEGGKILGRATTFWKTKLRVKVQPNRIESIAGIPGVKWVEEAPVWRYFNNEARGIMEVDTAWNTGSFFGAGQIIGVADTGLDLGSTSPSSLLNDFEDGAGASRVLAISTTFSDLTTGADLHGHGTHVAGSILGNGSRSGSTPTTHSYPSTCYAGIAPEAFPGISSFGKFRTA